MTNSSDKRFGEPVWICMCIVGFVCVLLALQDFQCLGMHVF